MSLCTTRGDGSSTTHPRMQNTHTHPLAPTHAFAYTRTQTSIRMHSHARKKESTRTFDRGSSSTGKAAWPAHLIISELVMNLVPAATVSTRGGSSPRVARTDAATVCTPGGNGPINELCFKIAALATASANGHVDTRAFSAWRKDIGTSSEPCSAGRSCLLLAYHEDML